MVSMRNKPSEQITQAEIPVHEAAQIEAIFTTALPKIYGYIFLRVSGNQAIAEDLTSETFLAFIKTWPERQTNIPDPIAWLIGIARNKVLNYYRAETTHLRHLTDWTHDAEQVPDIADELARLRDRDEFFRLLAPLRPEQRIVLLLHYLDGYSIREIASLIDKSEHAVESLLARARRTIRTTLDRFQSEEQPQ